MSSSANAVAGTRLSTIITDKNKPTNFIILVFIGYLLFVAVIIRFIVSNRVIFVNK